jgi:hypothetical protein
MKFEFKPLSEQEIKSPTYTAGTYKFKVLEALVGYSKSSGNPMLTLILELHEKGKATINIKDYLVESAQWKLLSFCKSIGKEGLYKEGAIEGSQIVGLTGFAEFVYEKNDKDGREYLKVKNYIKTESESNDFFNDNISF